MKCICFGGSWEKLLGNDCSCHDMPVNSDQKAFHNDADADATDSFRLVADSGHIKYQVISGDMWPKKTDRRQFSSDF